MEGSLVADFTDKMEPLTSSIGRDIDSGFATLRIVDGELRRTYLRLLPP